MPWPLHGGSDRGDGIVMLGNRRRLELQTVVEVLGLDVADGLGLHVAKYAAGSLSVNGAPS